MDNDQLITLKLTYAHLHRLVEQAEFIDADEIRWRTEDEDTDWIRSFLADTLARHLWANFTEIAATQSLWQRTEEALRRLGEPHGR